MGRSPDQFGPEGPEVSTAAACRSPAGNYMARPKRGFVPGGTNSSNPSPSSGESTNFRSPARARRLFYAELADGQLSASDRCELGYSAGMAANWLLWVSPVAGPRGGWLLSARLARCAEPIAGTQPGRREAIFIPLSRHSSPPVAAVLSCSRGANSGHPESSQGRVCHSTFDPRSGASDFASHAVRDRAPAAGTLETIALFE